MTVAIMMLVKLTQMVEPICNWIRPLVSLFDMISIISTHSRIIDSFPSVRQSIMVALANAFGFGSLVNRVQPCCGLGVVVNIKISVA